ncbi:MULTISPECIES: DegT/DnrJ/EryC1/StrS family aminotransferase [unclassified Pseudonocardia]|uniref:DegT/DnrJ/EryC1/StrS family aminotransferase n=1 Tax=unclassified Pseudonocardia TaxID=2619320 RepID=UPI0001FFE126|nr:DegT/DnrJ/EryC1/StrS family aminotransferase [Pseudonocardia sp. Ae707_Ps1]OLM20183.1 UDP-4-amino-4-deoxy-L-arabinose--oxoglutarate aminotransferase [Pseudonocardia sp. Ae707_Ps1]
MTTFDVDRAPIPLLDLAEVNRAVSTELDLAWRGVRVHGRFVGGAEVEQFESAFAGFCETAGAVGVANGTDALELVLAGLGVGRGDEVVVPGNTFIATVEAVCAVGAVPIFVDVLEDTLLIDPDAVAAAVTPRTAAVMAVHLYGQMADMDRLLAVTRRFGLALVEDAAQAHGARWAGRRAGSSGHAAGFSFYPGKNLGALGDGGAVTSSDRELLGRIRRIADHGRSSIDRYRHDVRGRNSRLDTLQAAVLSVKLPHLDAQNADRRTVMAEYRATLPSHVVPVADDPRSETVHHLAVVRVRDREGAVRALDGAGIGWGIHYPVPCHLQPAFAEFRTAALPVTEAAAGRILSLPMSPTMTIAQVRRVAGALTRGDR